jgi:hypothetical protein
MTRFTHIERYVTFKKRDLSNSYDLPMAFTGLGRSASQYLIFQPILSKEYGIEFDKPFGFTISSSSSTYIYGAIIENTYKNEFMEDNLPILYNPNWERADYWEGMERYRNKYKLYSDLGIFKSKEVLPEAMFFFHDYSIKRYFNGFMREINSWANIKNLNANDAQVLIRPEVNIFFVWWMRVSANTIKHKVNLLNTKDFQKELREIDKDLKDKIDEIDLMIKGASDKTLKNIFKKYGDLVMDELKIRDTIDYLQELSTEMEVIAEGNLFPTDVEEKDRKNAFHEKLFQEIESVLM